MKSQRRVSSAEESLFFGFQRTWMQDFQKEFVILSFITKPECNIFILFSLSYLLLNLVHLFIS